MVFWGIWLQCRSWADSKLFSSFISPKISKSILGCSHTELLHFTKFNKLFHFVLKHFSHYIASQSLFVLHYLLFLETFSDIDILYPHLLCHHINP